VADRPVVQRIIALLDGDHQLAARLISEMGTNPLTTFVRLLLQEERRQLDDRGRRFDGIVDDNQCKR
jgi:hypothetical protein